MKTRELKKQKNAPTMGDILDDTSDTNSNSD